MWDRLVLLCPAATFAPIVREFYRRLFPAILLRSPERARQFAQWLSSTPHVETNPTADLIVTALVAGSGVPPGIAPPAVLSDDELRRIKAPTTVVVGDCEKIYRGGPLAAIARAQKLIPEVDTHVIPGANHILTLDAPGELVDVMLRALA